MHRKWKSPSVETCSKNWARTHVDWVIFNQIKPQLTSNKTQQCSDNLWVTSCYKNPLDRVNVFYQRVCWNLVLMRRFCENASWRTSHLSALPAEWIHRLGASEECERWGEVRPLRRPGCQQKAEAMVDLVPLCCWSAGLGQGQELPVQTLCLRLLKLLHSRTLCSLPPRKI